MSPYFTAALEGNGKTMQNVSEKRENTPQAGQCEKAYAGEDADAEGLFREVFHPRKLSTSIQS